MRRKIPRYFLILLLTSSIILFGFKLTVFDFDFYQKQFESNNVYEKYDKETVDKNSLELINYLQSGFPLLTDFFNEKEKAHLQDVKRIIDVFLLVFYLSVIFSVVLILILLYKKQYLEVFNGLFTSSLIVIAILVLIFLLSLNFQKLFLNFHRVFFTNNLWLLNPSTDNLINLFPENFFISALKRILFIDLITALILLIVSFILKRTKQHIL